jgi:hypothetical protein
MRPAIFLTAHWPRPVPVRTCQRLVALPRARTFAWWWLVASLAAGSAAAQPRPFTRHFVAALEEHYLVKFELKADSRSVSAETIAAQTYVTPVIHSAAVTATWQARRKIGSVNPDGTAIVDEEIVPSEPLCVERSPDGGSAAGGLAQALADFCRYWNGRNAFRYRESPQGLLQQLSPAGNPLPPLGEAAPPLLALWMNRAVRPSAILNDLNFAVGATMQRAFQPASLKDARGSEFTEWLAAPDERPAATLHVLQQLSWNRPSVGAGEPGQTEPQTVDESFFADSLTTLALADGSVLHASRTASRSTSRRLEKVPGLPETPEFSSKLTIVVTIERLP